MKAAGRDRRRADAKPLPLWRRLSIFDATAIALGIGYLWARPALVSGSYTFAAVTTLLTAGALGYRR